MIEISIISPCTSCTPFFLSDRYKIFTSNWPWIEICEKVVLSKIDITVTTNNQKTLKLIKAEFCVIWTCY